MNSSLIALLMYLGLVLGVLYGWIMNIVALAHMNLTDVTGMLILRVVGIFMAPLGAVLGYI